MVRDREGGNARTRRGFSLVELMIVVAILGILAAIAIPNFRAMQMRAKRAELPTNVAGIRVMELAYEATYDTYVYQALQPRSDGLLDATLIPWVGDSAWSLLGWLPDGEVRGNYEVLDRDAAPIAADCYVQGKSDIDNDGTLAYYTATESLTVAEARAPDVY